MFGLLNLHKPAGPTSRNCVNKVQRLVKPHKVGHAGTLDPIASGVLLVLVGNATRLTDEIHLLNKEYIGTFQLGVTSPSADIETEVVPIEGAPTLSRESVEQALPSFLGEIEQVPPIYSAIRIAGKRAHEIARDGATVEMPVRRVEIQDLELLEFTPEHFKIRTVCSTGTYMRSLGRDIARRLGSDAVMTDLVRTRIGNLRLSDSVELDSLDGLTAIENALQPPQSGLSHFPKLTLPAPVLLKFQNGQKVSPEQIAALRPTEEASNLDNIAALDDAGRLRAILTFRSDGPHWRTEKFFM